MTLRDSLRQQAEAEVLARVTDLGASYPRELMHHTESTPLYARAAYWRLMAAGAISKDQDGKVTLP